MKNFNFIVGKTVSDFIEGDETIHFNVDGIKHTIKVDIDVYDTITAFVSSESSTPDGVVESISFDSDDLSEDFNEQGRYLVSVMLNMTDGNTVCLSFEIETDMEYATSHHDIVIF